MKNSINWKIYLILLVASILSIIAVLPYAFTLASETIKQASIPLPIIVISSIIQSSILFAFVLFVGLKLSKKFGLWLPILEKYLNTKKIPDEFYIISKKSILYWILVAIIIIFLDFVFSNLWVGIRLWTWQMPTYWMGFLASFYWWINEEILLRLFFMTFLVWIFSKIIKTDKNILKNNFIMWTSIIVSTVIFGLWHLPITWSVTSITFLVVLRALLLNWVAWIIFGWLYWKKWLESAIIAHFSWDIVLHFLFPVVLMFLTVN